MAKNREERQCTLCGKTYNFCRCSKYAHLPRYMDAYCGENCYTLYNVCAGFENGWMTPEEEAARLEKLDLSYKDKLPGWMQDDIRNIQAVKAKVEAPKAAEAPKAEAPKVEEKKEEKKTEQKSVGQKVANDFKKYSQDKKSVNNKK